MALDEPRSHKAAAMVEDDQHPAWQKPRNPAINYEVERDRYLEDLGEVIINLRRDLEVAEAKYAKAKAWQPDDFDPDPSDRRRPGIDPRLFSLGTDVDEQIRPSEEILPRSWVDVPVAGERV